MGEGCVRKANQPSRLFSNKVVHLLYGSLHVWARLLKTQAKINVLKMICKLSEEMLLKRRCDIFFFFKIHSSKSQVNTFIKRVLTLPRSAAEKKKRSEAAQACMLYKRKSQPPAHTVAA